MPCGCICCCCAPCQRQNMSDDFKERRKAVRTNYDGELRSTGHFFLDQIRNLSESGAFIDSRDPFPEHSIIRIRFTLHTIPFHAEAEVVRSTPHVGMGVRFRNLTPDQLAQLGTCGIVE